MHHWDARQLCDTAIIAVFKATGIRPSELAGLRYHRGDPRRSDIGLWQRENTVAARAASPGSSGSATRQPAALTGTCGPAPVTPRPGGTSCGSDQKPGTR